MTTLSDLEKRIKAMRRSYNTARKQLTKAMGECRAGTNVFLQHVKALADIDAQERAEAIALGIAPQDEGRVSKTSYHYVAFVHTVPASREDAEALVQANMVKELPKLSYTERDEEIRKQLQEEFK